jgi:hypothetical protein
VVGVVLLLLLLLSQSLEATSPCEEVEGMELL